MPVGSTVIGGPFSTATGGGAVHTGTGVVIVTSGTDSTYSTNGLLKVAAGAAAPAVAGTDFVAPGGAGTLSALTAAYVAFATSATAVGGDAAFQWDNTNKRLGVGAASVANAGTFQATAGGSPTALTVATAAVIGAFANGLAYIVAKNTTSVVEAFICATSNSVQIGSHTAHPISFIAGNGGVGKIDTNGDWVLGPVGDVATTATGGFAYMPSGLGAPTGAPGGATGKVAWYYDRTNSKIYLHNGTAWKSTAALT